MTLVDTSVWISHFREGSKDLERLLTDEDVICHSFVVGELACGNIKNRKEIFTLLKALPMAVQAQHDEVLQFIEKNKLMGAGVGYVDAHLLASAVLSDTPLWTLDKRLAAVAGKL